jgi:hypothetical protein
VSEYSSDRELPKCFGKEDSKTCPAPGLTTVLFVRRALSPASGDPFDRLPPPWTRICVVPAERPSTWALLVRAALGSDSDGRPVVRGAAAPARRTRPETLLLHLGVRGSSPPAGGFAPTGRLRKAGRRILSDCPQWTVGARCRRGFDSSVQVRSGSECALLKFAHNRQGRFGCVVDAMGWA